MSFPDRFKPFFKRSGVSDDTCTLAINPALLYRLQAIQEYPGGFRAGTKKPREKKSETLMVAEWCAEQIPNPVLRLRFLRTLLDENRPRKRYKPWLLTSVAVVLLLITLPTVRPAARATATAASVLPRPSVIENSGPSKVQITQTPEIWQVEKNGAFETYSNGLRIDNRFAVANRVRSYLVFPAAGPQQMHAERHSAPAGIVFHTTESLQAPFEADQNSRLQRIGESLLAYVKRKRAYNFLIDRFGRVYRVVPESDAANHAGNSIWSDSQWLYLNLNQSFLAVSFETRTSPGQVEAAVNPAQIRSADMLTEMLRKRYGIPAANCVTHGQVSVSVSTLRIGYHIDWASSFPFEQLGLTDNYSRPLPAVSAAGFEYDSDFARRAGSRLYQEARDAEQVVRNGAEAAHLSVPAYRKSLQERYRRQLEAVRADDAGRTDPEEE